MSHCTGHTCPACQRRWSCPGKCEAPLLPGEDQRPFLPCTPFCSRAPESNEPAGHPQNSPELRATLPQDAPIRTAPNPSTPEPLPHRNGESLTEYLLRELGIDPEPITREAAANTAAGDPHSAPELPALSVHQVRRKIASVTARLLNGELEPTRARALLYALQCATAAAKLDHRTKPRPKSKPAPKPASPKKSPPTSTKTKTSRRR